MGRFSLRFLFGVVALAAISCAGLMYFPELWSTMTFFLTVVVLLTSLLGAYYGQGTERAFWVGFAFFGCSYWFLVFGPWLSLYVGPHLGTSTLLGYLYQAARPWHDGSARDSPQLQVYVYRGGHALLVPLVAYGGGLIAGYFSVSRPLSR